MDEWTGQHAALLRRALRLTNERFAEHLGTAVRTVAKWNAEPNIVPTPELQRALDTALARATADARVRFDLLADGHQHVPVTAPLVATHEARLADDVDLSAALGWIDHAANTTPGTARARVQAALASQPSNGQAHAAPRRDVVSSALHAYYGSVEEHGLYTARTDNGPPVTTSILTRGDWLDLKKPVSAQLDDLRLAHAPVLTHTLTRSGTDAALNRLVEIVAYGTTLVNAPIYRLTNIEVGQQGVRGEVTLAKFVDYALTIDLLERELVQSLNGEQRPRPGSLPLRDHYLPDLAAVMDLGGRLCAGGALALTAIARPPTRRHDGDYLLLVQERSARVLNSNRRLAVIPKAFHGPLNDMADDAPIGATLERELEEELFGRTDVDSTTTRSRRADPMHLSRLSEPMAWLREHQNGEDWRMECTGFGYNLVSGNYEFASLVVVEDDEWWARFGGEIEANWETDELRRYSSKDRSLLDTLAHDPAWSNEGLFALLQGFRRLRDVGGSRVDLPAVELEL